MSVFRRVAPALACLILGGCWKGPAPLKGEETDAYGWRAALTVDAADSLYRFDIPSELQQWMTQHDAQVPAVFDADGRPMMCSTLRGYSSWRFRDRHSELFSVEWRWIPSRFALDMAIFYDAGKVTSRRSDLGFDGLKGNIGIGARFHGPAATPLRIELARGKEGLNLVFSGGPAF